MAEQLYREKSMDRISSPEQLNDYLKVTKTTVWVVLIAIILLLAGFFVWAALTYIGSNVSGTGEVKGGRTMVISFDDDADAAKVEEGMEVKAGDGSAVITRVETGPDGKSYAVAETTMADGIYNVKVCYKKTRVLEFLFGN